MGNAAGKQIAAMFGLVTQADFDDERSRRVFQVARLQTANPQAQLERKLERKRQFTGKATAAKKVIEEAKGNAWEILEDVINISLRVNPQEFTPEQAVLALGEIRGVVRKIDEARITLQLVKNVEKDVSETQAKIAELDEEESL